MLTIRITAPIVGWGNNDYGQTTSPLGLSNVVSIMTGWSHGLALTSDGKVVGWGENATARQTSPAG
jgi:alpha-tubulin suppressor-like RCC1 family protein